VLPKVSRSCKSEFAIENEIRNKFMHIIIYKFRHQNQEIENPNIFIHDIIHGTFKKFTFIHGLP
jgi:hypothetical protein